MRTVIEICRLQSGNVFAFRTRAVLAHLAHPGTSSLLIEVGTVTFLSVREHIRPAACAKCLITPYDSKCPFFVLALEG